MLFTLKLYNCFYTTKSITHKEIRGSAIVCVAMYTSVWQHGRAFSQHKVNNTMTRRSQEPASDKNDMSFHTVSCNFNHSHFLATTNQVNKKCKCSADSQTSCTFNPPVTLKWSWSLKSAVNASPDMTCSAHGGQPVLNVERKQRSISHPIHNMDYKIYTAIFHTISHPVCCKSFQGCKKWAECHHFVPSQLDQ